MIMIDTIIIIIIICSLVKLVTKKTIGYNGKPDNDDNIIL